MNLDFTTAKLKHSAWKLRLRDFLDGKGRLTPDQAMSHKDCELGTWLYAGALSKYSAFPEMKILETEHEALHRAIRSVVDYKSAGRIADAEAEMANVEPISRRIVELLSAVQHQINTGSPRGQP